MPFYNLVGINNQWQRLDGTRHYKASYKCVNAIKEEALIHCTNKDRFNDDEIEQYIINKIKEVTTTGQLAEELKKQMEEETNYSTLEKQLMDLKKNLSKQQLAKDLIIKDIDNLDYSDKHFERKREDLNNRLDDAYDLIDSIEQSITKVQNKIKASQKKSESCNRIITIMNNFEMLLEEMNEDERINVFKTIIKEIVLDDNKSIKHIIFNLGDDESDAHQVTIDVSNTSPQMIPYLTYPDRVTPTSYRPRKSKEECTIKMQSERPKHYNREQPTYTQIKDYVMEKYGIKLHTVYIAEVKRMHGINMQANRRKTEPKYNCPKDKIEVIEEALRHFNMIE